MKVEVEIPDEDAKWLEKTANVDVPKFIQSTITRMFQKMKEAVIAAKQGIPITPEGMLKAGMDVSQEIAEDSTKEEQKVE